MTPHSAEQTDPSTRREEELLPSWDIADKSPTEGVNSSNDLPSAIPLDHDVVSPSADGPLSVPLRSCLVCQSPRELDTPHCGNCGWLFPDHTAETPSKASRPNPRIGGRYEITELLCQRGPILRHRGLDHTDPNAPALVTIVELSCSVDAPTAEKPPDHLAPTEWEIILPDSPPSSSTHAAEAGVPETIAPWPSLDWEREVLSRANHPALPRVLDGFRDRSSHALQVEGESNYLVESIPVGFPLWDAWDDESTEADERFGWLVHVAEALNALHGVRAVLEGLRPELIVIARGSKPAITDVRDLLPIPPGADTPIQGYYYSAPELILERAYADARSDLYSFGAMMYALCLGRELTDLDFERQGVPKSLVDRIPDVHPALAQIVMKTFVRDRDKRYPTTDGEKVDRTGFAELIQALQSAGKVLSQVRLEIAGWSTIGMLRSGNEDAFAISHGSNFQHDGLTQRALIVLADGMGGYEAGEIASALAVDHLRRYLLRQPFFAGLFGEALPLHGDFDLNACQTAIVQSLLNANREISAAARSAGQGQRGMGCTAEVVYLDGRHVVVGHVGDSRTYHYRSGRLTQLTRDHTLVNRLVELGKLTPEEAFSHPRRNELQQALGSWAPLNPEVNRIDLRPGDWIIVCSDGLTNHVNDDAIIEMIQHNDSAEKCARCLVNLANWFGGSDNCTVVAVRAS